jgi:hypothetical protein
MLLITYGIRIQEEVFMAIADVQIKGTYIEVYDERGSRISFMPINGKEIVGTATDFFVVVAGTYIETYDANCRRINYMSSSGKTVKGASGNTFSVNHGSYIEIYDKDCNRQSYRNA